jgi:uncharacterized phiE125 gp8 family phage protein
MKDEKTLHPSSFILMEVPVSLDTLANVKARLGVTGSSDDSMLSLLMDSADAWIANYTGRDFAGGSYTEYFPGRAEFLLLANFPVASVTSVKVDPAGAFGVDTVISPSSYTVHVERGVIQSLVGPFVPTERLAGLINTDLTKWSDSPRAVQVVYAIATGAVPNDVKEAYAQLVGHWYRQAKTQVATNFLNIELQKFGDVTVHYQSGQSARLAAPTETTALLAPYRTPNV